MLAPGRRKEIEEMVARGRRVSYYNVDANDGYYCDVIEELLRLIDDPVAQLDEQSPSKRQDVGSSPSGVAFKSEIIRNQTNPKWLKGTSEDTLGTAVLFLNDGNPPKTFVEDVTYARAKELGKGYTCYQWVPHMVASCDQMCATSCTEFTRRRD